MKTGVKLALMISFVAGCVTGTFIQERLERPKIIENGAGHYDQISGQFIWGKPDILASAYVNQKAADLRQHPNLDAVLANSLKGGN